MTVKVWVLLFAISSGPGSLGDFQTEAACKAARSNIYQLLGPNDVSVKSVCVQVDRFVASSPPATGAPKDAASPAP